MNHFVWGEGEPIAQAKRRESDFATMPEILKMSAAWLNFPFSHAMTQFGLYLTLKSIILFAVYYYWK